MKKILAIVLALTMLLALAACKPSEADPSTQPNASTGSTEPDNGLAKGTKWNAVDEFRAEEDADSVWVYNFFDPSDSSFNPMGEYNDHDGSGIAGWYPWEGSWVGVGTNKDVTGYLEQNCEGKDGMAAVLGFKAPVDGKYVVTGAVYNPWTQTTDLYTVAKADGTVVTTEDISELNAVNGYITPTDVELKAGEIVYFYCFSTDSWVSAYSNITVHYEPTDASVYEKPEVVIPDPEPEFVPNVEGAKYNAYGEFSQETAEGTWVYASTTDGKTYTPAVKFDTPDWDNDGNTDAAQWYSANGTGVGKNNSVANWLEANVTESPENGGEIMALGFKAPAAGTYKLTVFTKNFWGQSSDHVVVSLNGEDIQTIAFGEDVTEQTVEVTLAAGEIVYIHGTSNGGWVSTYLAVFVTEG